VPKTPNGTLERTPRFRLRRSRISEQPQRKSSCANSGHYATYKLSRYSQCTGNLRLHNWEGTMKIPRRQFLHLAAGATALSAVSRVAKAQSYPTRPITMIVPVAAGGLTWPSCG